MTQGYLPVGDTSHEHGYELDSNPEFGCSQRNALNRTIDASNSISNKDSISCCCDVVAVLAGFVVASVLCCRNDVGVAVFAVVAVFVDTIVVIMTQPLY